MAVKKPIAKSIRLTKEVNDMIEGFRGEGFSEKLENLVRFSHKALPEKQKQLNYLDGAIKRRHEQCNQYWQLENTLRQIQKNVTACLKISDDLKAEYQLLKELVDTDQQLTADAISEMKKRNK